jgi:hypothetical protein
MARRRAIRGARIVSGMGFMKDRSSNEVCQSDVRVQLSQSAQALTEVGCLVLSRNDNNLGAIDKVMTLLFLGMLDEGGVLVRIT